MKIYLAIILLLTCASFGFGQTFAPPGEDFWVDVPLLFSSGTSYASDSAPGKTQIEGSRYLAQNGQAYFFIFSDLLNKKMEQVGAVNNFIQVSKAAASDQRIGSFTGKKYEFATDDGFYHRILVIQTNNHVYAFQTTSAIKDDATADKFFSSLQFSIPSLSGSPARVETTGNDVSANQTFKQKSLPGNNQGNERGTGIGQGSERAAGSGGVLKPPAIDHLTPLKLNTKPRANYTDYARFYEITGIIRARVTFGASGKIEAIDLLSKLPFGLTNSVIDAAKRLNLCRRRSTTHPFPPLK